MQGGKGYGRRRRKSSAAPRSAADRVIRLLGMVQAIMDEPTLRPDDLAARFSVSRRRIFQDLNALNRAGIRTIYEASGYRLQSDNGVMLPVPLSEHEAAELTLAAITCGRKGDKGARLFESARLKVARSAPRVLRTLVVQGKLASEAPSSGVDPEVARAMHAGTAEGWAVDFEYDGAASRGASDRRVHPHAIFFRGTGWYVVAWDPGRKGMRQFRMDRIRRARVSGEKFDRQNGFDLAEYMGKAMGVWQAKERLGARIRVLAWAAPFLRSEAKARGLPFEPWVGGEGLVRVERGHPDEVAWWVMQFAGGMEVLGPVSLRRRVAQLARAALELHGGASAAGEGEGSLPRQKRFGSRADAVRFSDGREREAGSKGHRGGAP